LDADADTAQTPPAAFYLDPRRLEAEAQLFARGWQLVGHAAQLAKPGDYFTMQAGQEPLLFLNDGGTLRGFYNVCRHRAGPIAAACGHATRLVCRYHGWTYDLAGRLLKAPEMEGALEFDAAGVHLESVAVHAFGPLLFASLGRAPLPFDEYLPGLAARCAPLGLERMRHVLTREYPVAANWKLYVDNFLEGYHIPMVHPALDKEIDYRSYVVELGARQVLQRAPVRTATATRFRSGTGRDAAHYFWLFPNVMLNFYEDQLQTNVVVPLGVDRTVVRFDWFALDAAPDAGTDARFQELVALNETVQAEDAAICEAVHRNLRSAAFARGRYSPARERGVHLFHRLMLGTAADPARQPGAA
jgi:choline monooxygenase